jgi:hypothetical protein
MMISMVRRGALFVMTTSEDGSEEGGRRRQGDEYVFVAQTSSSRARPQRRKNIAASAKFLQVNGVPYSGRVREILAGNEDEMERSSNASIPAQFHIYYSKRKIWLVVLRGLIAIAFFAFIVRASLSDWQLEAPLARISSAELWFLLLFLVGLLAWFIVRPLMQLARLSRPAVTMSRDGIALLGRAPTPWHAVKRSYFQRIGYGGMTVYAALMIKTSSATLPKSMLSDTLGVTHDEYEKQSRIYAKLASS